jgi:hypothetical protein
MLPKVAKASKEGIAILLTFLSAIFANVNEPQ